MIDGHFCILFLLGPSVEGFCGSRECLVSVSQESLWLLIKCQFVRIKIISLRMSLRDLLIITGYFLDLISLRLSKQRRHRLIASNSSFQGLSLKVLAVCHTETCFLNFLDILNRSLFEIYIQETFRMNKLAFCMLFICFVVLLFFPSEQCVCDETANFVSTFLNRLCFWLEK